MFFTVRVLHHRVDLAHQLALRELRVDAEL